MHGRPLLACLALLLVGGCTGEPTITIEFTPKVGDATTACGESYDGVGTTGSTLSLRDFRLYVHDVRVLTTYGRELPVTLTPDGAFQDERVALLDFEDGAGECISGTPETHTAITGTLPEDVDIAGVRFRLGVPEDLNHRDVSTAPAPLNVQSMYWGWNGGYKFLRVDGSSSGLATGFFVHLGSTGCMGDMRGNVTGCTQQNRVEVELDAFDPATQVVAVDVGALLESSNIDEDTTAPALCMSGFDDADCAPVFDHLGLAFDGTPAGGPQRLFRVSAP